MQQRTPKNKSFDSDAFLAQLTELPGVYQMLDAEGCVLYVGKARNLKKRVSSYFRKNLDNAKTAALMARVCDVNITITETENEALLLECTLIKKLKPHYNILMRDDKSYPYIFVSSDPYPRIVFHRGAKREKGQYFGPYPNGRAVRETLNLLQKIFTVRQCSNVFFKNRKRPCLQYQIGRCSAPCTKLISEDEYAAEVRHAILFLSGKDAQITKALQAKMDEASNAKRYEEAAIYRDKVARLRTIWETQSVSNVKGEADVFALAHAGNVACIHLLSVRKGRQMMNKNFFPKVPKGSTSREMLTALISQYYLSSNHKREIPARIIVSESLEDQPLLADALSATQEKKISIATRVQAERASWLKLASVNAKDALGRFLSDKGQQTGRLDALQKALDMPNLPARIECFDISHTGGNQTVASCVVFDGGGARNADYRRFNINGVEPGDDYAAMEQALTRRYKRLKKDEAKLPNIILVDGGKGQLSKASAVLSMLGITQCVLLGISKGRSRKPGLETLHLEGRPPFALDADSPALHLLQQIRDEAHRFAITGHRARRQTVQKASILESIPGIGAARRRQLLRHFGGLQGVKTAGVADLTKVEGISRALAQKIYDTFHGGSAD